MPPFTEIVTFSTVTGTSPEQLLNAARTANEWLSSQPGYRGRRLSHLGDNRYCDLVFWASEAEAKAAAARIMEAEAAGQFMQLIDPATVDMQHGAVIFTALP